MMAHENQNEDNANEYNISKEELPESRRKIEGEIPWEQVAKHRESVMQDLQKEVNIDGFRKGNVPEDVIIDEVGEDQVLYGMAQRALQNIYPGLVAEHAPNAVGQPQISITKLAEGNPVAFSAEVTVLPEITLPDYKQIAGEEYQEDEVEVHVDESDVQEAIDRIRKQWVQSNRMEKMQQFAEEDSEELAEEAAQMDPSQMRIEDEDLPELTDEFVQKLGQFESVEEFKSTLRQNILNQEQQKVQEKQRMQLIEAIIEEADMEVPEMLVQSELDRMMNQFQADVKQAGAEFDDYLDQIDKTEEELREEWRPDAEKQAKIQLVLNKIAAEEEIEPDEEELQKEVDAIKDEYESADEQQVRTYVATMLRNEKVFELLESQS
jgi:trigger factor